MIDVLDVTMTIFHSTANPSFLNVPIHQVFVEGSDAVVECPAFFGSPPTAIMLWKKGSKRIYSDARYLAKDGWLKIANIRMKDAGEYKCFLSRFPRGVVDAFRTIQVEVEVLP